MADDPQTPPVPPPPTPNDGNATSAIPPITINVSKTEAKPPDQATVARNTAMSATNSSIVGAAPINNNTKPAYDLTSLPDVVKSSAQSANDAAKRYGDVVNQALPTLQGINNTAQDRIGSIYKDTDSTYSTMLDASHRLENLAAHPFSEFLGLFDSDYNKEFQRARLNTGNLTLQNLSTKLDAAKTARDLATNNVTTAVQTAKESANAASSQLGTVAQSIDVQNNLLQYSDNVQRNRLHNMTDQEIAADKSIPPQFKTEEVDRRKSLGLNLSNLESNNTILTTEAKATAQKYQLERTNLDDPTAMGKLGFTATPQQIQEEKNRRATNMAGVPVAQAQAVDAQIKARSMNLDAVARTMTTQQLLDTIDQAGKSDDKSATIKNPITGNDIKFTQAELSTMLGVRTKIDNDLASQYGQLAANRAGLQAPFAAGTTIISRLATMGMIGKDQLLENDGQEKEIQARIANGDIAGASEAAKKRLASAQKLVDDNVSKYDEPSRPFLRQFIQTAPDAMGSIGQGDAAKYLVSQAVNGNMFKGTQFESLGKPLTTALLNVVDKRLSLNNLGTGKAATLSDLSALLSTGKFDAAQILREALEKPMPGSVTPQNPAGRTIQQEYDARNFERYLNSSVSTMGATSPESQEFNPVSMVLGPDGALKSQFYRRDPKTGAYTFDTGNFIMQLEKLNTEMHAQGRLSKGQDLTDTIMQRLNSPSNLRAFGDRMRGSYDKNEAALSVLLSGGKEESAFSPAISYMQQARAPARQNAMDIQRGQEATSDYAKGMIRDLNENLSSGSNPMDMSTTHTPYGDILYDKSNPAHKEKITEALAKMHALGLYKGNPDGFGPSTARTGAR